MNGLRVLIVADDPLTRAGLAMLLHEQSGCDVVGQVSGVPDDLSIFDPDVIVWDLGWDEALSANLERLASLEQDRPPVLALLSEETYAAEIRLAGAGGLLLRDVDGERLASALAAVTRGLLVLDPALVDSVLPSDQAVVDIPLAEELTPRELEVLQLLAEGLSNRAISYRLGISDHTVKYHVTSIMSKLDAQSRTEAVVRATRLGLIIL